jgi:hypothetical protein
MAGIDQVPNPRRVASSLFGLVSEMDEASRRLAIPCGAGAVGLSWPGGGKHVRGVSVKAGTRPAVENPRRAKPRGASSVRCAKHVSVRQGSSQG